MNLNGLIEGTGISSESLNNITQSISSSGVNMQGFSMESLVIGGIIGVIGLAYFRYGKKQSHYSALFSGIAMMAFPYFVYDIKYMILITICLCIFPFFVKI